MSMAGFNTDEELINYCDIHCESERALFSGAQILRMGKLANAEIIHSIRSDGFYSMHSEMKLLVDEARNRQKIKPSLRTEIGVRDI